MSSTSAASSRLPASSRNMPNSLHSSSTSSMQRPATAYGHHRPTTAMAQHNRFKSHNLAMSQGGRPVSSMDSRRAPANVNGSGGVLGEKQKGMAIFPDLSQFPNVRVRTGKQQDRVAGLVPNMRTALLNSSDAETVSVRISSSSSSSSSSSRIISRPPSLSSSNPIPCSSQSAGSKHRVSSLSAALHHLTLEPEPDGMSQTASVDDAQSSCPKTPSFIPKPVSRAPISPVPSPETSLLCHQVKPSLRSRSPQRNIFLTKDSNIVVPAWDADERFESMSGLLNKFMENVNHSMSSGQKLEEIGSIYKSRSK